MRSRIPGKGSIAQQGGINLCRLIIEANENHAVENFREISNLLNRDLRRFVLGKAYIPVLIAGKANVRTFRSLATCREFR